MPAATLSSPTVPWHALPLGEVFARLESDPAGLSRDAARGRLARFGPNRLPHAPPPSAWRILARQFTSPLIFILAIAAAVSLAMHPDDPTDAIFIAAVLLINAWIGGCQEWRAEREQPGPAAAAHDPGHRAARWRGPRHRCRGAWCRATLSRSNRATACRPTSACFDGPRSGARRVAAHRRIAAGAEGRAWSGSAGDTACRSAQHGVRRLHVVRGRGAGRRGGHRHRARLSASWPST